MDALIIGLFIFSLGYLLSLARWFYHEWEKDALRRHRQSRLTASNKISHCHQHRAASPRSPRKDQILPDAI